jgi:flagellar basal body-associated protein FliL
MSIDNCMSMTFWLLLSWVITAVTLTIIGSLFYVVKKYTNECPKGCTNFTCYIFQTWIDDYNHGSKRGYDHGPCSCLHYNSDGSTVTTCANYTTYNDYSRKYIIILIIGIIMLVIPFLICFIIELNQKKKKREKKREKFEIQINLVKSPMHYTQVQIPDTEQKTQRLQI